MKNKDVINVITQGRAYKSSSFLLKMAKNIDKLVKNSAYICPKKQFPTAVLRNKARRKFKAAITSITQGLKRSLQKDYLYVFTIHKNILNLNFAEIKQELEHFVAKNDILKP